MDLRTPPVDPGNPLLAETLAMIQTTARDMPAGPRLALTIRTSTTTLTVILDKEYARRWGEQLCEASDEMSGIVPGRDGHAPG